MNSKKEQILIERFKAAGGIVNDERLNAPFVFIIRPFTTVGVEDLFLAAWLEDEIFSRIKGVKIEFPLKGISIFPAIFDESVAKSLPDKATFRKSERVFNVKLGIDFHLWSEASKIEKIKLLHQNVLDSLSKIPTTLLPEDARSKLIAFLEEASDGLRRRVLN